METRLEAEIPLRAEAEGRDADEALRAFKSHIRSLRTQLEQRREFILSELKAAGL